MWPCICGAIEEPDEELWALADEDDDGQEAPEPELDVWDDPEAPEPDEEEDAEALGRQYFGTRDGRNLTPYLTRHV